MFVAFNALIVFMIVLIAYWWANQGLFSALLHLLCVIIAGVIALAVWEPITVNYLLGIRTFDDYAWGISLVGVFVVSGLILRIATNKLVPANVQVPRWANLVFGGALGAVAGVFSIGILMIGAGLLQSSTEIIGYRGMIRESGSSIPDRPSQSLWVPAHEWTYTALSLLSDTSLSTRTPLSEYNPHLDYMAASLMRDSFRAGRGKISLDPDDVTLDRYQLTPNRRAAAITMSFKGRARDYGEMLTISKSQVRLIMANGRAVHPFGWSQRTQDRSVAHFRFDDKSHYATSVPGADNATIMFKFNFGSTRDSYGGSGSDPGLPRFIQVRGTRFELPQPGTITESDLQAGVELQASSDPSAAPAVGGANITSAFSQGSGIRGVNLSVNQISGMDTIQIDDEYYLSEGEVEVAQGGPRAGRRLRIHGIYEPPNTRVLQINISRSSPANLFDRSLASRVNDGDVLTLVDTAGLTYAPIGFVHRRPNQSVHIKLDPSNGVRTMAEIPPLPTSGDHQLSLVFRVTQGVTIQGLKIGDVTIGTCSVVVELDRF